MNQTFKRYLNRSRNTFKKYISYTQYNDLSVETFFKNCMKMSKENSSNQQSSPKNKKTKLTF